MKFSSFFLLFSLLFLFACNSSENKTSQKTTPTTTSPSNDAPPVQEGQVVAKTFRGMEIRPISFPGQTFLGIRKKVPMDQIQNSYGENLSQILSVCQNQGLQVAGMPSGLFYEFNEEARYIDMAATIAVTMGKEVGNGIEVITLPSSKALRIDHYGPYKGISNAHFAMDDYMSTYKLQQNRAIPVIEEYVTDPGAEPDPNKRLTRLTYFYQ